MQCALPLLRDEPKLCLVINLVGISLIQSEDNPISLFQFRCMDLENPDRTTTPWIFLDMVRFKSHSRSVVYILKDTKYWIHCALREI